MTQSLYWKPEAPIPEHSLSDELKNILVKRYSLDDTGMTLDLCDVQFLEGLEACGIEDVDCLLKGIREHNSIRVYLE